MRSFRRVLAAGLLIALAAAACSPGPELDSAASALPSAVPTSSPESTPIPENRPAVPSPTPTPEPIPTPPAPPGPETLRYLVEVQRASSDLVAVAYAVIETDVYIPYFPGQPLDQHRASPGFTPDGSHAWVPLSDPANRSTCPEGAPGTALGISPIEGGAPVLAQPAELLPPNITQIHRGPQDQVLIYSSCGKHITPTALARVLPDGNFADVHQLDHRFAATTWAGAPRWHLRVGMTDDRFNPSPAAVTIVQRGLTPEDNDRNADDEDRLVSVTVDFETGQILNVESTGLLFVTESTVGGFVRADLVEVGPETIDLVGSVWTFTERPVWSAEGWLFAFGGHEGAGVASNGVNAIRSSKLTDAPTSGIALAPSGQAVATTGINGTLLHIDPFGPTAHTLNVSPVAGQSVEFSPDGSRLLIDESRGARVVSFRSGDLPNDDAQISPFSSLTSGGLGPLRIGATLSEVNRRFGWGLEVDSFDEEPVEGDCVWINGPSVSGINMIGSALPGGDAEITRIYVWAGPWHTPSGLRLGSTDQNVADALGDDLARQPHEYTYGDYLDFVPTDPTDPNGVRFETDTQVVDAISVGRLGWIELVEGCA